MTCLVSWVLCVGVGSLAFCLLSRYRPDLRTFAVAAMFGATGAMLSVATRLRSFALHPCQQSGMNYVASASRIGVGFVAGPLLLLLWLTVLNEPMKTLLHALTLRGAAILGLFGGFAERLVPNLLRTTIGQIEPQAGTPVQAVEEQQSRGARPDFAE